MKRAWMTQAQCEFVALKCITEGIGFSFDVLGAWHFIDVEEPDLRHVHSILRSVGWSVDHVSETPPRDTNSIVSATPVSWERAR